MNTVKLNSKWETNTQKHALNIQHVPMVQNNNMPSESAQHVRIDFGPEYPAKTNLWEKLSTWA